MTHGTTHKLLDAYPKDLGDIDQHKLAECIAACYACSQACTACADACLSEDMVAELTKCIRTDLDCADICTTTGNILSRHTGYDANITRAMLQACATVCKGCGDECQHHAGRHEHCRICAEACERCEQACNELLTSLG
ncbi:four-helix bundle copper-binding protein [Arthrobacter sp. CDRTa11]|uniref:four-helix bundle copper-binding protein n=1 Tax=Arthrobacter sp. CDRTa11 TaxID=2651199 RepID=UPI002265B247|nr:four-helix bundle copper-binding protein [Arthrobacter sp. CDRTa11]UZX04775.1 four-helix bundle copper-binding protein [Arthrobacter sp. CDRTa11]